MMNLTNKVEVMWNYSMSDFDRCLLELVEENTNKYFPRDEIGTNVSAQLS